LRSAIARGERSGASTDAMTELVAEKIIELAQRENQLALHLAVMTEFESDLP
jgi:TorA maturation chaperone TorD